VGGGGEGGVAVNVMNAVEIIIEYSVQLYIHDVRKCMGSAHQPQNDNYYP
jgi:hypothetical protein